MKRHLKRATAKQQLSRDELYQLAVHIEGCLNSRPLRPHSDDPTVPMPLTPAHVVLGKPILPPPVAEDVTETADNRLICWGQRQKLLQQIWQRWSEEVLANLQTRTKWFDIKNNLKVGDMVIVKKEYMPPAAWCLGRVIKVFTNKDDGLVRAAIIKTPTIIGKMHRKADFAAATTADDPVDHPINGGEDVGEPHSYGHRQPTRFKAHIFYHQVTFFVFSF